VQEETQSELQQVRAALKRISEGEYGICSECGQTIGAARLAALPYATLCIECAERLER
jgi:RNA polymerase-binding protein DksA